MKICGIVSEYNPFHKGHEFHIKESKKITGCDAIVCVMSGNFVQRGEPAILNKFERAKIAVNHLDAVIELPCAFSLSSAEDFAYYAVKILNDIKAEYISFGSECGDIDILQKIADLLTSEPLEFKNIIKAYLKHGFSLAKAKTEALKKYFNDDKISDVILSPNNLLGIEYLKAIKKLKSKIIPITVKRTGSYNEDVIDCSSPSSKAIRYLIEKDKVIDSKNCMDKKSFELLNESIKTYGMVNQKTLSDTILYKLRTIDKKSLKKVNSVCEGLENRIKEFCNTAVDLSELIEKIETKRYPNSRLKRILMNAILDIDKKLVKSSKKTQPYIKILAINNKDILTYLSSINVLTIARFSDYAKIKSRTLKKLIEIDIKSTSVHNILFKNKAFNDYGYKVF